MDVRCCTVGWDLSGSEEEFHKRVADKMNYIENLGGKVEWTGFAADKESKQIMAIILYRATFIVESDTVVRGNVPL